MNYLINVLILSTVIRVSVSFKDRERDCKAIIVESIPFGLTYNSSLTPSPIDTYEGLLSLITSANHSIEIASYYWTLLTTDVKTRADKSSLKGKQLFNAIINSSKSRKVKLKIVVNDDQGTMKDSEDLQSLKPYADIRLLNFSRLIGAGILHTKFILVDKKDFYIGSANMDWRSLTQVKEIGIILTECQPIAEDLSKIFEIYWVLGKSEATVPKSWPKALSTQYNRSHPMPISLNQIQYNVFLSSSPKSFCSEGRTDDIDAVLSVIRSAKKFVYISVMDYFPQFLFTRDKLFWPVIDNALREAVINRRVSVRLMASQWKNTRKSLPVFLKSLAAFSDKKLFKASIEV